MDTQDYDLRTRIEEVSNATDDENDLISVAIPPEKPLGEVLERVEEEHAEVEYIDSEGSSRGLREALGRVRHALHGYERTPENGLAVYAGVVDGDTVTYVFDDLPAPVREFTYVRSNEFTVDPLRTVTRPSATYGLLVVERGGAALGLLSDDRVRLVEEVESGVMGKTRAGGQSAQRFERERERQKREFFDDVADEAARAFLDGVGRRDGDRNAQGDERGGSDDGVDGLLVGGTEVTVDGFLRGEHLDHRLRDRVVGDAVAVEYASEQGLRQLADKARERIDEEERRPAREAIDRFYDGLEEGDGTVVYGREAVEEALTYDAVETLLVSDTRPSEETHDLADRAADQGGERVVVPTDIERGRQFDEAFGVAAILRFPLE